MRQFIRADLVTIWLDDHYRVIDDQSQQRSKKISQLLENVMIFNDSDECIDFITDLGDQRVFLIVCDVITEYLIPGIHAVPQICSIHVICQNSEGLHQSWFETWPKIRIHSEIEHVCEALQLLENQYKIDSTAVTFISASEIESNINSDRLDPTFMYTQLLKKVILEMKHDEQSRTDFLQHCQGKYAAKNANLTVINEFAQAYRPEEAIFWYTREPFIYEELNQSLRLLRVDRIIDMRFFIHDLHQQLAELHKAQIQSHHNKPFKVYRGQRLSFDDFKKLRESIGGLVAFNCFLSTSHNRNISELFYEGIKQIEDMIGILYVITVYPNSTTVPFANINGVSNLPEEDELLFSMHAIFRIREIIPVLDAKNLYEVHVESTKDTDLQLGKLMQKVQQEVNHRNKWVIITNLLMQVAQPEKARDIVN